MRALIIEDESAAAHNLRTMLTQMQPPLEVVALCESVVESVEFLATRSHLIDIIFMDIHLADGDAFKIFERVEVNKPIIFTTAYDQYALQAFKVSSIDYLLKPINAEELERALSKLHSLTASESQQRTKAVVELSEQRSHNLLIHLKDKIIPIKREEIAYIYTSNERTQVVTLDAQSLPLDKSLDAIYSQLDSDQFYRANRQFVVSRHAVQDVSIWFGSRLSLNLCCPTPEKVIIPKARIAEFKEWLSRVD